MKPRISMSVAAFPAAMWTKPMSAVRMATCGTVANMRWVCASIRPGISVRPPPAMRVSAAPAGGAMGAVEIAWMTLPTTRTFDGAESRSEVPSKTRTFSKSTAAGEASWACAAGAAHATTRSAPRTPPAPIRMRTLLSSFEALVTLGDGLGLTY